MSTTKPFSKFFLCLILVSCGSKDVNLDSETQNRFEIPYIEFNTLLANSANSQSEICEGSIQSTVEYKNARVEIRRMSNDGRILCLFRRDGNSSWKKFAETSLSSFSYHVTGEPYQNGYVDSGGSNAPWWDCQDFTSVLTDSVNPKFGYIIISFRRQWSCHGEAGGTYQQGLLTLFIDTDQPETLVRALPGLEILEPKQLTGSIYGSQNQFCTATGYCQSLYGDKVNGDPLSVSIVREDDKILLIDPSGTFNAPPILESTLFEPRSLPCIISNMCEGKTYIEQ